MYVSPLRNPLNMGLPWWEERRLPWTMAELTSHFRGNENKIVQDNESEFLFKMVLAHRHTSIPDTPRKQSDSTWCWLLETRHRLDWNSIFEFLAILDASIRCSGPSPEDAVKTKPKITTWREHAHSKAQHFLWVKGWLNSWNSRKQ